MSKAILYIGTDQYGVVDLSYTEDISNMNFSLHDMEIKISGFPVFTCGPLKHFLIEIFGWKKVEANDAYIYAVDYSKTGCRIGVSWSVPCLEPECVV